MRFLPLVFTAIIQLFLYACSSVIEPSDNNSTTSTRTRGVQSEAVSEAEAVEYAKNALDIDASSMCEFSIEAIISKTEEAKGVLPSDTIAYVVTFVGKGSVLIANDSNDSPVLLTKRCDKFKVTDGKFDETYFKDLEGTLIYRSAQRNGYVNASRGHGHWFAGVTIYSQITTDAPFNSFVIKKHPNCDAGSVPGNCAAMLSYTQKVFRFNKVEYSFPLIASYLRRSPQYSQHKGNADIALDSLYLNKDLTYVDSYEGSVAAIGNLISDFGETMHTSYNSNNSTTDISDARKVLENAGCEVSPLYSEFSIQGIWNLLYDGYIVLQEGSDAKTNEKLSFLITGGENIYYGDPRQTDEFYAMFYCVDDKFDLKSGVISSYEGQGKMFGYHVNRYFGVKIQKGSYGETNDRMPTGSLSN